jgi:benzoate-CoA ligase
MSSPNFPYRFNAASHFVDANVEEGRGLRVALECGDEHVTYQEVLERVNRFGSALGRRFSVRMEERVVLLLLDTPAFAYSFFGTIKIGAVAVPVNTLWKAQDLRHVLNDSRARVLIVSAQLTPALEAIPRAELPWLEHVVVVADGATAVPDGTIDFGELLESGSADLDSAPTCKDDAAFWLYSSGSTGDPKGCVHLQHDMAVSADQYAKGVLGMTATDRCFSVAKLFFAYGLGNGLYMPFSVGARSILWSGPPAAANVYRVIERHRPTLFFSVPTGYAMMLALAGDEGREFDLTSIWHAVSAGEALPPALFDRFKERFGIEILDGIGATETTHMFISNRPGQIRRGSSGLLVPGYEARILDDERREAPAGTIGNLYIKGDSICAGYWNQHEKTKDTIEGHWIRTGDKYSRDEDGFFWYAGRTDDMLKVGGLWVSPIEVEHALLQHAAVQECAVVGFTDRDELVKPFAFVVLRDGVERSARTSAELQAYVKDVLPVYKRPRWVEFLTDLPKTATGKVQRFQLRERLRREAGDPIRNEGSRAEA